MDELLVYLILATRYPILVYNNVIFCLVVLCKGINLIGQWLRELYLHNNSTNYPPGNTTSPPAMGDDFRRLVSQSNPATRQYQPANNGYPPSSLNTPYNDVQSPQLLDPFFDDEDEQLPDSGFGRPEAMHSQESGLPLARSAAPPAGLGHSQISLGDGVPQGWNFDDDDFRPANNPPFSGSASFPGLKSPSEGPSPSRERKWKWPWAKEKEVKGERIIALNNRAANDFCSNFVSTSKYSLVSSVPKFFFGN